MQDSDLIETLDTSSEVFQGNFLRILRDSVTLPDGALVTREYAVHPGAVMVVPLLELPNGECAVVLERQYRYPIQRVMLEFPAGTRDAQEGSLHCAMRELREETGYTAGEWAYAGVLHPCIAYSTEVIEVWFARALVAGPSQLDQGEFLEVFTTPVSRLLGWCQDGTVTDSKTLSGAFWLQAVLQGTRQLEWKTYPQVAQA